MSGSDRLIAWLNDAYAMEQAMESNLERHAKDAEGSSEVRARLERHIEETRTQAQVVKECIESLGGSVSGAKSTIAGMFGAMQGMANKPAQDTMVKNMLSDYAAEHFEIACYNALIDAAREVNEGEVATRLTQVLHQEEAMAQFLQEKIPEMARGAMATADR